MRLCRLLWYWRTFAILHLKNHRSHAIHGYLTAFSTSATNLKKVRFECRRQLFQHKRALTNALASATPEPKPTLPSSSHTSKTYQSHPEQPQSDSSSPSSDQSPLFTLFHSKQQLKPQRIPCISFKTYSISLILFAPESGNQDNSNVSMYVVLASELTEISTN